MSGWCVGGHPEKSPSKVIKIIDVLGASKVTPHSQRCFRVGSHFGCLRKEKEIGLRAI